MSSMREPPVLRWRKNHLPDDIVLNILARLPVKSVLRFRCVCKSWNSSITSPSFISSYLKLSSYHSSHRLLFVTPDRILPYDRQLYAVICEHTFDRISEFDITSNIPKIVGSCNGLLCLSASNCVYFLNPSIGKFKRVSLSTSTSLPLVGTGFGYNSKTNDYKFVRISYRPWSLNERGTPPQAEIYSLNSGLWRRLHSPLAPNTILHSISTFYFPIPFVSGALHWTVYVNKGEKLSRRPFILTFDVNEEKFGMIATPFNDIKALLNVSPLAFKGKLALAVKELEGYSLLLNVWVMKEYGVHQSWTKLCVIPFYRIIRFYGYSENGLLIVAKSYDIFSANGEVERKALKCVSIDIETLHENDVGGMQHFQFAASFTESLVLLDRADMVPVRL